ncbi:MAG: heavy metal-responsive transcriptional regulator [Chloroflexi bacterium]|nr:heavy metal-responsive transcriptional regulator [Chloroflexota bacterium]
MIVAGDVQGGEFMKIGELARTAGLNAMTIRYYESLGLLPRPERTSSNYRMYEGGDIERLQFIKKSKRLGLSLEEIKSILQLHDRRQATCVHVRTLLEEKLARVDTLLRELREFRRELMRLRESAGGIEDCRPSGGHICGIIERGEVNISDQTLEWVGTTRRTS